MMNNKNNIFIITGEVKVGKTFLITNLISSLRKKGITVKGVLSPAKFEENVKTGIYAVDLSTGIKKLFANFHPGWDIENSQREWKLDPEVLKWGDEVLKQSVPTEVLVIDELGFLEFEKNQGWVSAFKILQGDDYDNAIVVVRTGLLKNALTKWPNAKVIYLTEPSQQKVITDFLIDQLLNTIVK
jgi:nucleoside-triphosphatase THEP1